MADYVTVSAEIPRKLKELLDLYGVKSLVSRPIALSSSSIIAISPPKSYPTLNC